MESSRRHNPWDQTSDTPGGSGPLITARSGYNHVRLPRLGSMWGASIPTVAGNGGPASESNTPLSRRSNIRTLTN
ncbi:hypothetical protein BDV37DRAFT_267053 [Aspergillus pseudonomiae]|uniref:Uncharacterized protein n=1 Tax=Aspergillus pseudonomiae TaxID=1506151 RepID=A0A5N7CS40_9EURO|nr:uncharacterized protein BDV37DRAFT_267053 [Aspergillus pseudonomiae]KAE8396954.1 hypothetical protein BDV37DRAFT_267053 [Aspergillus pseudonomiae]